MALLSRAIKGVSSRDAFSWAGVPPYPLNSMAGGGNSVFAGVPVTNDSAMRHATVWACTRLIAGTVGQMPLNAVEMRGGLATPVDKPALLQSPSDVLPTSAWVEALTVALLQGNAFGLITAYGSDGLPVKIELLNVDEVEPRWENGPIYRYRGKDHRRFPDGDMWHVPAFAPPGSFVGLSPVAYAKQAISLGLAAEKFGAQYFGEGGVPSAILSTEQPVTQEQADTIKGRFMNAVKGRREPAVLGGGVKYEAISVAPNESQMLETQMFSAEQVCRIYGVAPEMVGVASKGSTVTYANRDQRVADFLAFGLGPWLNRIEEALSALLPQPMRAKFNTGAILRADVKTRYEMYDLAARIQAQTGEVFLATDEMRLLENMEPLGETSNLKDKVAIVKSLVQAGFEPSAACALVGLPNMPYVEGLHPASLIDELNDGGADDVR
jgi:HK97 family phage portal protein